MLYPLPPFAHIRTLTANTKNNSLRRRSEAAYLFRHQKTRPFHNYFVTRLPSSSLRPDSRSAGAGPNHHKLPRSASTPHSSPTSRTPAALPPSSSQAFGASRASTVVRIPLRSAKHHFGAGVSRGSRPYNEDTYQVGTIEIPAFAKRQPISLTRKPNAGKQDVSLDESDWKGADSASGDPQVFYFGVFDGHGGSECSEFLKDRLHSYVEEAAGDLGMESSLQKSSSDRASPAEQYQEKAEKAIKLQQKLAKAWKDTVGGYFKRFKPEFLSLTSPSSTSNPGTAASQTLSPSPFSIEPVLSYAFLTADLDFTTAQASKHSPHPKSGPGIADEDDPILSDRPLNDSDVLHNPSLSQPLVRNASALKSIGGPTRFLGGSTASVALISTPTSTPFWHPASPSTLVTAHVGDTRILLCRSSDGKAVPLTTSHHPSTPIEATRLRRYAATFITDSFGEERVLGLANTRAFGDVGSKRIGVSAEPEINTAHLAPGEYSFLVLVSDGVSGTLSDQEIVDIAKEAQNPNAAASDVVSFAVE
ncbi:hypothetical protein LTR28_009959, partial [Elasticomyces elasticus]